MTDFKKPKLEVIHGDNERGLEDEIVKRAFSVLHGNKLPAIEPTKPVDKLKYNLAMIEDSEFRDDREIHALRNALVIIELVSRDSNEPLEGYVSELRELMPQDAPDKIVDAGVRLHDSIEILGSLFDSLGGKQMGQVEVEEFVDAEAAISFGAPSGLWYDRGLLSRLVESINIAKQLAIDSADQRHVSLSGLMANLKEAVAVGLVGLTSEGLDIDNPNSSSLHARAWGELALAVRNKQKAKP